MVFYILHKIFVYCTTMVYSIFGDKMNFGDGKFSAVLVFTFKMIDFTLLGESYSTPLTLDNSTHLANRLG